MVNSTTSGLLKVDCFSSQPRKLVSELDPILKRICCHQLLDLRGFIPQVGLWSPLWFATSGVWFPKPLSLVLLSCHQKVGVSPIPGSLVPSLRFPLVHRASSISGDVGPGIAGRSCL